jgi:hypothetical protein
MSASNAISSSLALDSQLLSGTGSVGFTTTGSFTAASSSLSSRTTQIESVYATTGSNSFRATQSITGSLTVTGQIVAQTLNVQQVTSSIVYSSGSNVFGCDLNSRQTFTGSVNITGSLIVNTTGPELQVNNNGVIIGNLLTDNHSITGSLRITGSNVIITGALSGTSATFSGNLNLQGAVTRNINFYDSSNTNINAQIQYDQIASNSGQLLFGTNNAGTFATRLTIANTGAATFSSSISTGTLSLSGGTIQSSGNYYIGTNNANFIQFYTSNQDRMIITSGGDVSINDTTANTYGRLQVTGASSSGITLALTNPAAAAAGVGSSIWFLGTTGYNTQGIISTGYDGASVTAAYMAFSTRGPSTTERMRITSVGNLEMRPIIFSGVANNAVQTILSSMGKGTWLVSVANDVDSSDGYSAMLWVRTNEIIQMQVFRVDSMVFSYTNQDLKIQKTSGFTATLYVTAIRMAAS